MEPVSKTYPGKYIPELQQSLLDKQDISSIDAIAGATTSSNDFKALVGFALDEMAKKGDTAPKTIPLPAGE
jgi:major membrane immunogen (membrane-anchored lipoprotein)